MVYLFSELTLAVVSVTTPSVNFVHIESDRLSSQSLFGSIENDPG